MMSYALAFEGRLPPPAAEGEKPGASWGTAAVRLPTGSVVNPFTGAICSEAVLDSLIEDYYIARLPVPVELDHTYHPMHTVALVYAKSPIANQFIGIGRQSFGSTVRPQRDGIVGWAETDTHVVVVFDHDDTFTAWARDRIKAQKLSLSTPSLKELVRFGLILNYRHPRLQALSTVIEDDPDCTSYSTHIAKSVLSDEDFLVYQAEVKDLTATKNLMTPGAGGRCCSTGPHCPAEVLVCNAPGCDFVHPNQCGSCHPDPNFVCFRHDTVCAHCGSTVPAKLKDLLK